MQKNHMMERRTQNIFSRDEIKQKHCGFSICNCKNKEKNKIWYPSTYQNALISQKMEKKKHIGRLYGFCCFT